MINRLLLDWADQQPRCREGPPNHSLAPWPWARHFETLMATIAAGLPALGVGQLVWLLGVETAGACVQTLGLHQLQIDRFYFMV